ncbi:MAG TPA: rod shape-determining protein MreC [Burkholderiales bacterium]|nr:rod shape-determining protein MreC [Burkholderiales bacterium]
MDHTPPPFFKRGPAPLVRLFFFASLSLALLVVDARFRYVDGLRSWLALAAYPIQRAATWPIDAALSLGSYFSTQASLIEENERLRAQLLASVQDTQRYQELQSDAAEMRRMIGAAEKLPVAATPAEVLYLSRDPYAHKLFIDRGSVQGVRAGSPVADDTGVVGQVTRVHPLISEVTLLTNPDQAVPVQVVRNGLRAVAFGGGASGMLELRYMPANVAAQEGDQLVTSGIDGTYPAGLPVATIVRIERDPEHSFARVTCKPAAGIERGRYVLVLSSETARPPRPEEAQAKDRRGDKARRAKAKDKSAAEKAREKDKPAVSDDPQ